MSALSIVLTWGKRGNCLEQDLDWELDWVLDQGSNPNMLPCHSSIWMGRKNRRGSRSVVVLHTSNMCYL